MPVRVNAQTNKKIQKMKENNKNIIYPCINTKRYEVYRFNTKIYRRFDLFIYY